MRRAVLVIVALATARWAVLELASYLMRRRPPGPSPLESERIPGRMPRRGEA